MRDMLERLQAIREEQDNSLEFYGPERNVDEVDFSQEVVVFKSSDIDELLQEVHSIQKEISSFQLEVERFCMNSECFTTTTRCFSVLKRNCDSIARGLQQHGEALHTRLQTFGKQSKELQEQAGPNSAVSRIARTQYDALTLAFHTAMRQYNTAEEKRRAACRGRIQRQASILGSKITDKQLDELVDKGCEGWAELSHNLQTQSGHSSRWALNEIKGRHKELVELEARMNEVHELFLQMAILVEEQGVMLNNIEAHVSRTGEYVKQGNFRLNRAIQHKKKNPFRQCCSCLPFMRR
ncbi:syntaxin-11-like [Thalassophryne amazonica]|uniref:syntaxin-11-like n=1 Tax=Thalassophryne amazonica TaxID=390379 RepID=UPI001470D6B7|nr:syntaxin-11-like [Thalassophryne amazonica]